MAVHHRRRGVNPSLDPPPPQTKATIVGKNEIYNRENLIGPFLVQQLLGLRPPPSSNTSLGAGGGGYKTVAAVIGVGGVWLERNRQLLLQATSPSGLGS